MTAKVFGWQGRLGRGFVLDDIPVDETTTTTGALVETTTTMDDVTS